MNDLSDRSSFVAFMLAMIIAVTDSNGQGLEDSSSELITETSEQASNRERDLTDDVTLELQLEPKVRKRKSRIGLGFSFLTGTKTSVSSAETFDAGVGPATGGSINRTYADGYVFLDSSGNLGDLHLPSRTHFFGFDNPSQINSAPLAGTIDFHETRFQGGAYGDPTKDSFSPGLELFYNRSLKSRERVEYAMEVGLGFHRLDYQSRNRPADFEILTDTYELGGVDPLAKGAPYLGTFLPHISGSPKIGDLPNRHFNSVTGHIMGGTSVDSFALLGRLGPTLRYKMTDFMQVSVLGGLLLGYMSAEVAYAEVQQFAVAGNHYRQQRTGAFKDDDIVWGFFGALRLNYDINHRASVFGEGRYMHTQSVSIHDGIRSIEMDLAGGIGMLVGVDYRF
ncbi:MAG: hypothetical protein P8L18_11250 [Verrucomicrobiota bacterium]|nr:hypothetical protein [Verrucomicrobiota bacterium]